ncbi:MBG domain-containing protein [Paenimyroides ceti]
MKKHVFFLLLVISTWASFAQTIRYVKEGGAGTKDGSSWSNASDDLQLMINQSTTSNQIWVAAGTYKPNRPANNLNTISVNNRENAFVLKDGVKLYGGFSGSETSLQQRNYEVNKSILSGDLGTINNTDDNAYHVIISANVGNETLLDGFTVTKGNANGGQSTSITINGQSFAQSRGGGMSNGLSSVIISNCMFTENMATVAGAIYNTSSPVNISNSTFLSNTAAMNCGGVFNISASDAIITNCNFIKNTSSAWGGAMLNDSSAPVITGCTFTENIANNRGGALYNENAGSKIYSSVFVKNTGSSSGGGAIWHNNSNMWVVNCTIYGNTSGNSSNAGGVHANNGRIFLYNSLLWNNQSQQYTTNSSGTGSITLNNNLIQGYTNTTNGNLNATGITTEQIFINATGNDFQLKTGSPAIGKGSNSQYTNTGGNLANDKDVIGNVRFKGINIDIGAYEAPLLPQNISASDITKTYGNTTFIPNATASTGLEVSYVSADSSIAEAFQDSTDGNKWKLRIKKAGIVNITAKQAGNDTYAPAPDVIFKLTINKAALTVSADAKTKVYGTTDPSLTYTVNGFINGDTQSIITGSLSRTTGESVATYTIEQGTLTAGNNYDITYTAANFNVTPASLNITAENKTKVYGTTDPAYTYTVAGFVNGDTQSIITGVLARTAGENTGIYTINKGTLTAGNNYVITYLGANLSIVKAKLNIAAQAKTKVYGATDPDLTYSITGLVNGDDNTVITGILKRIAGENIGTYAIELGTLTTTSNYDLVFTTADFNITKATLNIAAEAKSKVYGTTDPALTYTVTGLANGDNQSIITGALSRTTGENIGTYKIQQGTLATTANYDLVFTAADLNITKATLNIVAEPKSKVYGTTDPALTYTVTGLANNDDQSIITGALARTAGENIGTYEIQQGTLATTANYDIVYTAADFTITKATLNIAAEAKSKVYGTTDPKLTYTVTGLANNDDQSIIIGALSRTAGENIGPYEIQQGTLSTTANYDIAYTTADFNITKATLIVRADNKAKVYGTIDPSLTYTVTGLVNGDDQTALTGTLSRANGEVVGSYAISQGTLTALNYDLVFTAADFNITKATLNIAAESKSKVYGTTDPALTYTVSGLANNDDQSIITGALSRTTGENIGTYEIQQGTLAATANYDITYTKADFDITKATLNIAAEPKSKVYGTTDPVLTYTVTGLANNDDQSIITGALSRTTGENIGTYEIQQGTLATTANYDITYTKADFGITKATLNIVAEPKAKVYGTTDPVLTYTVTGLANNDDQSIITGALTRVAGENIGTYEIQQGTLATTANYELVFTAADFDITKATLNIVAEPKAKVYGTTDPVLTYTVSGLANNDDQSIITGALSRTTGENIGTYEIQQGTLATTANYDITYTKANFDITKATLNIVAEAKAKVYGTTDPVLTYTVTGLANNDDQSIITGALSRTAGENIGTYEIQQGTLATTANYDITYTKADFDITKATLNIVAEAKAKVYGTTDPVLTYTVTGLANNDDQSIITGALSRTAGENIGTYEIQQGTLATTANYDLVFTTADFNITKATLNIVAEAKVKVYGTADPVLTYTVTGLANNDDQSIITGALSRTAGENIGTYEIQQGTLATTANYDITYTKANFDITKATLNIVAEAKAKVYGTTDPALTYTVTGLANNDDQSIITGALSRTAGENIGTYEIQQGTLATTANYELVFTAADFNITKATLNIAAEAKAKVYGTADPVLTYTVTGLANNDDQSIITGALSRTAGENIGTYEIQQGTLATTANYDLVFTAADFNITKATLNIAAEPKAKVYGTTDPALTYTVSGLANNDDQSTITGALSRTAGENIGTYEIQQGTLATTANYDLVFTAADFNITKATLNIVAEPKAKVYGTTDPVLTYTVTGLANNDDQSIITGALTRTAGENIGTYEIQQGTLAATANYYITYTKADFDITKATLNIVAEAKAKVYGTADPALTYTVTGLANNDAQSIITGALSRTTGENIGTYEIQQGTLAATANYDITYTKADFDITKATLNIAAEAKSKVYGTTDPVLTYTVTGLANNDDQSIITGALTRTAGENIGTYEIQQGTLATTANYELVFTAADFNITKATLNIVAEPKSKVYGTTDPVLTYTVTGLANNDDQSIITGALARTAGENIGTYEIQQGTLATTANYDITYTKANFDITKATLNIVAEAKAKVYGTTDPVLTYTVTGLANNDDQSIITGALSRTTGENIGTYEIQQGTLATTANYDLVFTTADFTITKATLNIAAEAKAKVYGTTDPVLTYTVTGLANNDDQSIITGALSRTTGENIGTYEIQQGTLAATANYDITYTKANFDITKATLNIVAEAKAKVYGTTDPVLTYTVTGLANNDDQSIITGALSRTAGENIGTYEIQQGTLATTANYDITYTKADFDITKATLNIVAEVKAKVYGTTDPVLTYTVTGLANNDDQSIITGALSRTTGENIGTYEIQQGTLATTANYDLVFTTADFNITKATLNIVAEPKSKVYGTTDPALTYTVTGLANNDDQSIITGALSRTTGENIGTYEIQQGTLATTANYDLIYTGADFDITKATLNIVAEAKTKVYGTTDPALTYTVTGLANNDDQSIITGALTRTAGENIGTYEIQQGTLATTTNYDLVFTAADFNITKATLNIVADAKAKVYGTIDPTLTYTVNGLANNDDQSIITGALSRTAGENIGTYEIQQGTLATTANYELVFTAADFDITKATLNIVAEPKAKVYGTTDPVLTYTVSGLANNDDQSIITGALSRTTGENIGTYEIQQGTLATTANYDLVFTAADFNITKATLNVVADAKAKVYGTTDPVLTYTVTGLTNGDDQSVITGSLSRVTGENIGTYEIQQGTLAATANYDITYTKADFDITKATLNIVAEAKAKVYGTTDPVLTYTVTGLANNDDQSIITGALSRTAGENIGTYEIQQGTLATTANYDLVFTTADFNITKATLNIVAEAKVKVYGTADPVLTYTVTGLANNDDQSIITGALSRTAGENIGTYEIQQGTLATTANYDITYTKANFDITKATLNIVAEAKAKVYGTTDPALTYTVTGLANNDDQSIITGALSRTAGENIGTYEIQQGTLATTANYELVFTAADFNITKATLNIAAEAKAKVYGTADPVLTYTVTGLANNDDQSIITGALSRTAGENIGTYEIQQGTLATTANYDLVFTAADFNITKATLNIAAEAKSKVYGTTDPVLTYTVTGLANNDDQSIITGALSRTTGENIGTYEIQQGTLAATANYDITYTKANFDITKATLNIVAEAKAKVYGTTDPALTYTVTGLANNDDQSIITGALTRTAGETAGIYEIQQGTLATTTNYDLVFTTADFNITKATLNVVAEAKTKVYGTTDPALTYQASGFVNADTDGILSGSLTRTVGENTGTYVIEQGTLMAGNNYDIAYISADFDITKATLNIVADAKNKVYGTTDPVLTYTATGFANGDNPSVITGNLSRDPGEDEGTYAIQQGTLNAYNYNMVYTGADFIIFKTFTIIVTDQTNVTCNGGADGSATVEVNGGIPQYTYSWAPYGGNQATANGLTAGTYTVTITDAIGLEITQEFIITEPPVVVPPTAQTLQTICASADLTLNDIQIQGTQIKWYATAQDTNELPETTALVNGTTYYASQTINGCESVGRTAVTVTLNTIDAPVVEPYSLCQSATVADLEIVTPTGVSYKWYTTETGGTELSEDTVLVTQTYYVEKTEGDCVSQRTAVQVTILEVPESPTGAANQSFTVNNIGEATIADLVMDQENIIWYISLEDAMSGNDPLAAEMPLENGQTYYAVLMNTNGCSSVPTAVTVDITLSTDEFDTSGLKYYPNPTSDILTVTYKNSIDRVTVYNLIGQRVMTHEANSKEVQLNMSALANGNYMLEIRSGKQVKFVKVVKK